MEDGAGSVEKPPIGAGGGHLHIRQRSLLGIVLIIALCWGVSENRRRFPWRLTLGALSLRAATLLAFFAFPGTERALGALSAGVEALTAATREGTAFVFGYLAGGAQPYPVERADALFVFAFQVLPLILVVSALSAFLWHIGLLGLVIRGFGLLFQRTLGLGGATALAVSANVFMGMVEAPILIRGYLERLTRAELFMLMSVGLATVAGSTLAAYAALLAPTVPNAAGHVLAASLMSAPAGVLLAQVMVPEPPGQGGAAATYDSALRYDSAMDALLRGVSDGLSIALNVAATLLVLVALVALANFALAAGPDVLGAPLSVERVLAWAFAPLAWALGVSEPDVARAGELLGVKMALTEFIAYVDLAQAPPEALTPRSRLILTYALCGFANLGSVGIMAAGLATLLPNRRAEVLELSWKALPPGFLAACLTGAVLGALPEALYLRGS